MRKLYVRSILFYFPALAAIVFVLLMLAIPREYKIATYRFFFSEFFWLSAPYALLALAYARVAAKASEWFALCGACAAFVLSVTAFYARFIEPEQIVIRETNLHIGAPLRIALIADAHIGFLQNETRTQQVVDALNRLDVDVVAVAGDWTYEPVKPLRELLAPLSQLRHRMISVPGNHDEELPGPPLAVELRAALVANRVEPIEGQVVAVKGVRFVGMGDRWAHKDFIPELNDETSPLVALTHNPDSYARLAGTPIRTMLAGHTHGGQINLPWITAKVLKSATDGGFKAGMYNRNANGDRQVFVTTGLGTVGFPMRLFQPPVIDVLICR
jgi:uncharacterized protein